MWLKRTKCPDLCQYQEKDDILSGTDTKKIRGSLLGLKHSIKKKSTRLSLKISASWVLQHGPM